MPRLKLIFQFLLYLPWTIRFNFHYLPFRVAMKLPVILYRPKLLSLNGLVTISGGGKIWNDKIGIQ